MEDDCGNEMPEVQRQLYHLKMFTVKAGCFGVHHPEPLSVSARDRARTGLQS